jgi:hypothetical protein
MKKIQAILLTAIFVFCTTAVSTANAATSVDPQVMTTTKKVTKKVYRGGKHVTVTTYHHSKRITKKGWRTGKRWTRKGYRKTKHFIVGHPNRRP